MGVAVMFGSYRTADMAAWIDEACGRDKVSVHRRSLV